MQCIRVWQVWDGVESGRCLRVYTCHSGAVRDACWTPCGRHLLTGSFDNTAVITDVETGEQQHFFLLALHTQSHTQYMWIYSLLYVTVNSPLHPVLYVFNSPLPPTCGQKIKTRTGMVHLLIFL